MPLQALRKPSPKPWHSVLILAAVAWTFSPAPTPAAPDPCPSHALLLKGDRVSWIGSSSTKIGVWNDTAEFLLRTRHPDLNLQFQRFTTGGGTFATGLEHLDEWLGKSHPSVVIFNYGGNDARASHKGLSKFHENMTGCMKQVRDSGARVILVTPQPADVRKSGAQRAADQALYAESMLGFGRQHGWPVIDVHHPLDLLLRANQSLDPDYTILRDRIHLTNPAYIAWGYFFYDRLDLPLARSEAVLSADGNVSSSENCEIRDIKATDGSLTFTRLDKVLPILPPGPLPPRLSVPLEAHSLYLLAVSGLKPGDYEIRCDGQTLGVVDADTLSVGVNLNSLLLDTGAKAPWNALAQDIWDGENLDRIGQTRWKFEIRKR